MKAKFLAKLALLLIPLTGHAVPISLSSPGVPYTQDFNTLASSGTSSTLPTGWAFSETGSNANGLYAAGSGSLNTGDTTVLAPAAATSARWAGCAVAT
jgi:hypothetical protein